MIILALAVLFLGVYKQYLATGKLMKIQNYFLTLLIILSGFIFATQSVSAQTWAPTSSPGTNWTGVASSADGRILYAVATGRWEETPGPIFTSTNYGTSWAQISTPTQQIWSDVACSADGNKVVVSASDGPIYVSTNSGVTWQLTIAPSNSWAYLACSGDGSKIAAITVDSVYVSTNSGTTWTKPLSSLNYAGGVAVSANGSVMAVTQDGNAIFISTNSGTSWTANEVPSESWEGVAVSPDGTKMAIVSWGGSDPAEVYVSTNCGTSWRNANAPGSNNGLWHSIAMSADGTKLVILAKNPPSPNPYICTSPDFGSTWITNSVPQGAWYDCASSADGCRLAAVALDGPYPTFYPVYVCSSAPIPKLELSPAGANFTLSWIVPSTNFVLQQSSDLTTTNWVTVTNAPILNLANLHNEVTLPASVTSTFFRLKTP